MNQIQSHANLYEIKGNVEKILKDLSVVKPISEKSQNIAFCNPKGRILFSAWGYLNTKTNTLLIRVSAEADSIFTNYIKKYLPLYRSTIKYLGTPKHSVSHDKSLLTIFNLGDYCEYYEVDVNSTDENFVKYKFISNKIIDITSENTEKFIPNYVIPALISYDKGCYVGQEIIARLHYKASIDSYVGYLKVNSELKVIESNLGQIISHVFFDNTWHYLYLVKKHEDLDKFLSSLDC
jgi:folate-binding protein YgfZ